MNKITQLPIKMGLLWAARTSRLGTDELHDTYDGVDHVEIGGTHPAKKQTAQPMQHRAGGTVWTSGSGSLR